MPLRVVGAGLPRTGTNSQQVALQQLLGGRCYHMHEIPGHPFNLGDGWRHALAGETPDWDVVFDGYVAAVDWPASMFWRELSEKYSDALVLLSTRDSAETWYASCNSTILPVARDWQGGSQDFQELLKRFTGQENWDDKAVLMAAYDRHNADVRATIPPERLLDWRVQDGWEPLCRALNLPVPDMPFPWTNKREEWG
jgi:hypothetical protein